MAEETVPAPTYRRVGGWQMMQWPPFHIEKVTYFNYVLDADLGALTRLCEAFFNAPSGGQINVKPLIPQIILSYAFIEEATSSDPAAGSTPEKDILLWVPVVQLSPDGTKVIGVPVFSPFIFVDNAVAVSMGREMFGFPKNWCALPSFPDGPTSQASLTVDTYTKPPDEPVLKPRQILDLKNLGGGKEPTWFRDTVEVLEEIATVLTALIGNGNDLGPLLNAEAIAVATKALLAQKQDFLFLKQFPSMTETNAACYQSIGQMNTTLGAIRQFGVLPYEYELSFVNDTFHHLSEAFGWPPGVTQRVKAAFYMDFSFTIDGGEVIWKAP